mmetsp:Transcript_2061/g.4126  ORF Transcript_2061/g.4126 Transcript_2061/m.4126 type:complete len:87 (-) Transcript_2061:338-598(-)
MKHAAKSRRRSSGMYKMNAVLRITISRSSIPGDFVTMTPGSVFIPNIREIESIETRRFPIDLFFDIKWCLAMLLTPPETLPTPDLP